jgi:hypothetical protein
VSVWVSSVMMQMMMLEERERAERVGAGIERENPCLFGFFLEPLVDGRCRGGGKLRGDAPNLDWIAFANESVGSGYDRVWD